MAISESSSRKVLFSLLIILTVALIVLLIIIYSQLKSAGKQVGQDPGSLGRSAEISPVGSSTSNVDVTYNLQSPTDENVDLVKDVANKFMQAKEDRSFTEASALMTGELKAKWNEESFAGNEPASGSPTMDRFEITSVSKNTDNTYSLSVTSYWLIGSEPADTVRYSLELMKREGDFLVSKFDMV